VIFEGRGALPRKADGVRGRTADSRNWRVFGLRGQNGVQGSRPRQVDVRVIAATNRDLEQEVARGRFRQDLFFRLNVVPIIVPPLRERKDDVPLLVHLFLDRFSRQAGKRIDGVSQATMARLAGYDWPGNVRELQNVIERAFVLARGPVLEIDEDFVPRAEVAKLDPVEAGSARPASADRHALEQVTREHIVAMLEQTGWRIDGPHGAARLLKLHPSTLRSRMQKLGIRRRAAGLF
jgi:formate hydrogenlyase transcriptional activator